MGWKVVSIDGVHHRSLVASVSGIIDFALLSVPSLEGFDYIVHLHVDCIFGFGNENFLSGLCWSHANLVRNGQYGNYFWHLAEQHTGWECVRRDSLRRTCYCPIEDGEALCRVTFVKEMLTEFVVFERHVFFATKFDCDYPLCSTIGL